MGFESSASQRGDGQPHEATSWTDEHLLKPLTDNVLKPVANSLLIQPYDAAANVVNFIASPINDHLLPKLNPFQLGEAKFLSPAWFAQNISGGLATAAVFAGAGKLTGMGLSKIEFGGALGSALASRQASQIIGGALYEGIRDPNAGESHFGNLVGGAVAFSVFEGGNSFARSGFSKYAARAATGGLGMTLGHITSESVTQGQLPTWQSLSAERQQLGQIAVTGAAMNLILPTLQRFGSPREALTVRQSVTPRESGTGTSVDSFGAAKTTYRPALATGFELSPRTSFKPQDLLLRLGDEPETTPRPPSPGITETTSELPASLTNAHVERVPMVVGANPEEARVFDSREDYENEARLVTNPKMKIMSVLGHPGTEVAMPVTTAEPISAQAAVDALNNLPDMRLVQRLTLLDETHPEEEWLRQTQGNPNLTVNAEAIEPGGIRVYKPGLSNLPENVTHEWNHLLRSQSPQATVAFDQVGDLEPLATNVTAPFESRLGDEQWSYLGEHLAAMPHSPADALMTASANPIRSTIWAKTVADRMATLPESERSVTHESHQSLIRFVDEQVKPEAMKTLQAAATGPDAARQARAQAILKFLQGN